MRPSMIALLAILCGTAAFGQTFTNPTNVLTSGGFGNAAPYPSTILVQGVTSPVGSISIKLRSVFAPFSSDMVIGLVAPDGTIYPIVNRCGNEITVGTLTIVPAGLAPAFEGLAGTHAATSCADFVLSGVTGPIGELGDLIGRTDVNGVWSLYVADRGQNNDNVSMGEGWSISFGPVSAPPQANERSVTYQGRVDGPDGPINSEIVATFRLFEQATGGRSIGLPVAVRVTPQDGVFSTPLDFGPANPLESATPLWLEVTINGDTLVPRQRITATPRAHRANLATVAERANVADVATSATNALNANVAAAAGTVPWAGITGIPANVANLRLAPAPLANSSLINGSLGLGAEPLASSRLHAVQPAVGATDWHIELTNSTIPAFRGGIRINNAGFLDISNNATSAVGFFARLNSTGAWTAVSDARLKTDVRPATGMLDAAMKLRPVYFHWLSEDAPNAEHTEDFGLIAQEVREVLPRLVTGDESKDTLTVNYSQLSVVAIAAIQELKAQHEAELAAATGALSARIEAQERQLLRQSSQIEELLRRLNELADHTPANPVPTSTLP